MNGNLVEKRPHLIPGLIAAVMLLLALVQLPYGYYQLLRWVVCGVSIFLAYTAYDWKKTWATWLFVVIALLFNPLIPIYLSRELWQLIDMVSSILFFAAILILRKPNEERQK